jgi:methylenetetrahydrofolate reductase (NADPH)
VIPDEIVERLRKTPKAQKKEEGKKICIEIIEQVREIQGVAGVHVMAYRQEELVTEIIEEAGLLPRPLRKGLSRIKRRERNTKS